MDFTRCHISYVNYMSNDLFLLKKKIHSESGVAWLGSFSLSSQSLPVFTVTATASKETRMDIIKHVGLINCVEIVQSPDRPNIRLVGMLTINELTTENKLLD